MIATNRAHPSSWSIRLSIRTAFSAQILMSNSTRFAFWESASALYILPYSSLSGVHIHVSCSVLMQWHLPILKPLKGCCDWDRVLSRAVLQCWQYIIFVSSSVSFSSFANLACWMSWCCWQMWFISQAKTSQGRAPLLGQTYGPSNYEQSSVGPL